MSATKAIHMESVKIKNLFLLESSSNVSAHVGGVSE